MTPLFYRTGWPLALLLVALCSCHDAPRDNPFDPALTPPVELQVALDDTAGTATLTWTPYEGQQPFEEYRVLRKVSGFERVDTLVHLPAVEQTAFVDTTLAPNTAYVYRVAVVNTGGYAPPSEEQNIAGYTVGPVSLVEVEVDAQQGQARLRWMRFNGARFAGYRVERRSSAEEVFGAIAWLAGVQDTVYVDEGVEPEVVYFYRIVVEAAGQDWPSTPSSRQGFVLEPVQLLAATGDPQEGVVRLRWGRFTGPDFAGYQVWRRVGETIQEELLAVLGQVQDTMWVDTTARTNVGYVYRVEVQAAGQQLSSNPVETRLLLLPVLLSAPQFDSRTASASLKWTPYEGPRFKAYRVERRTAELVPQAVAKIEDLAQTAYVDSGLVGDTEYFYRVVVVTERGEEVLSEEQSGIFHQRLATWPLEIAKGEYVRLYREGAGITALVAGKRRVRLFLFDAQGVLLEEQVLLQNPLLNIEPRSVATALGEEGRRYVSAAFTGTVAVLGFGADGRPLYQERQFFADSLSALISGPYATVRKRVAIYGDPDVRDPHFFFDQVEVSAGGQVLFEEDFEGEPEDWDSIDKNRIVEGRYSGVFAAKSDESWQDFRLEAEVLFGERRVGGIEIGTSVNSSLFRFILHPAAQQQVQLFWTFIPEPNSSLSRQSRSFIEPFSPIPGLPYRLGLGFREGQFSASISSPLVWSGAREGDAPWASLAGVGQSLLLVHGDQVRVLSPEGEETLWSVLEEQASETRSWKLEGRRGPENWIGLCLPARNQILFKQILVSPSGEVSRPSRYWVPLGAGVGQGAGELIFPLSFDAGADGRFLVLDAGNARIQVFDQDGKYLTQWGRKGSRDGEFDFGSGSVPEDFAGSVAVDEEGYIYVAEVGNKRIQKFAP